MFTFIEISKFMVFELLDLGIPLQLEEFQNVLSFQQKLGASP